MAGEQKFPFPRFDLERFKQEVAEEIGIRLRPLSEVQDNAEHEPTKHVPRSEQSPQ